MLTLERVSFAYPGGGPLFADLDAHVGPGEVLAVVGRNGAGKSTLLRLLNGLLRPTGGRVRVQGTCTAAMKVNAIAVHIGTLFQSPEQQLFAGSVRDEVSFGPRQLGFPSADVEQSVARSLARTGLAGETDTHPLDLDYARRRFVALASVLAARPVVLLLDEPQRGLDRHWTQRLETIMAEEREASRSIVLVCHDMDFVERNATHVLALGVDRPQPRAVAAFFGDRDLIACAGLERTTRSRIRDPL